MGYFSLLFHKFILCDPLLEQSHQGNSNEGSHHMILLRNKTSYLRNTGYPFLSGALADQFIAGDKEISDDNSEIRPQPMF